MCVLLYIFFWIWCIEHFCEVTWNIGGKTSRARFLRGFIYERIICKKLLFFFDLAWVSRRAILSLINISLSYIDDGSLKIMNNKRRWRYTWCLKNVFFFCLSQEKKWNEIRKNFYGTPFVCINNIPILNLSSMVNCKCLINPLIKILYFKIYMVKCTYVSDTHRAYCTIIRVLYS